LQIVTVRGSAPLSAIVSAIESSGRSAILRGSGDADSPAAVSILESYASKYNSPGAGSPVRGLMRCVQVSPTHTVFDIGLSSLCPGKWEATIREAGDLSAGAASTGAVWSGAEHGSGDKENKARQGWLGEVQVDGDGRGNVFIARAVKVWEIIGRGFVVSRVGPAEGEKEGEQGAGVIARSAGVWDNDKAVCSCSGKTVWEEREEQRGRGML
jgi:copper chaperone for superoxide dismutase